MTISGSNTTTPIRLCKTKSAIDKLPKNSSLDGELAKKLGHFLKSQGKDLQKGISLLKQVPLSAIPQNFCVLKKIEQILREKGLLDLDLTDVKPEEVKILALESPFWLKQFQWNSSLGKSVEKVSLSTDAEKIAAQYLVSSDSKRQKILGNTRDSSLLLDLMVIGDYWQVPSLKMEASKAIEAELPELKPEILEEIRHFAMLYDMENLLHRCLEVELFRQGVKAESYTLLDLSQKHSTHRETLWFDTFDSEKLEILRKYPSIDYHAVISKTAMQQMVDLLKALPKEQSELPFKAVTLGHDGDELLEEFPTHLIPALFQHLPKLKSFSVDASLLDPTQKQRWIKTLADCKGLIEGIQQTGRELNWVSRIHQPNGKNVEIPFLWEFVRNYDATRDSQQLPYLKILAEAGVSIDYRDINGSGPLHNCSDPQLMEVLLQLGLKVNDRNCKGSTPLHCIVRHKPHLQMQIGQVLQHHGADFHAKNDREMTPLHVFIQERWLTYPAGEETLKWYIDRSEENCEYEEVKKMVETLFRFGPGVFSDFVKTQVSRMTLRDW